MFSIKNITRAALVSAALNSATADVLSHQTAQVAGEETTSLVVNQQDGSGSGSDMFVDTAEALIDEAMSAATEATNTEDLTVGVSAAGAQELTSGPLRAIVDFEAKLFGAETDEALTALVAEMKESEQGHDEEVRAAIASLDDMRGQVGDVFETVEESDRAILIAEIFTAMIAQSPVDMVVQTINALKASEETPKVEDLENIKAMMMDGLSKQDINSISDTDTDMPTDMQVEPEALFEPEVRVEVEEITTATTEPSATTTTEEITTADPVATTASESVTESTSTAAMVAANTIANFEQTDEESAVTGNSSNGFDFEEMKVPLIIAGSVVGAMLVAIGAMVGIRRRNRGKVAAPSYEDFTNPDMLVLEGSIVEQATIV